MRFAYAFVLLLGVSLTGCDDAVTGPSRDAAVDLSPAATDLGCEYPQQRPDGSAPNDPRCPSQYGGSAGGLCFSQPCPESGLRCTYYGVGDGTATSHAIAVMTCGGSLTDGGVTWVCAN